MTDRFRRLAQRKPKVLKVTSSSLLYIYTLLYIHIYTVIYIHKVHLQVRNYSYSSRTQ